MKSVLLLLQYINSIGLMADILRSIINFYLYQCLNSFGDYCFVIKINSCVWKFYQNFSLSIKLMGKKQYSVDQVLIITLYQYITTTYKEGYPKYIQPNFYI